MASFMTAGGIPGIAVLPWGAHVCQLYRGADDLVHSVVPYLAAGLRAGERCLWLRHDPLPATRAAAALTRSIPDLGERVAAGQLAVRDQDAPTDDPAGLVDELAAWIDAATVGARGVRVGWTFGPAEGAAWEAQLALEDRAGKVLRDRSALVLCGYPRDALSPARTLEIVARHQVAITRRSSESWTVVGNLLRP